MPALIAYRDFGGESRSSQSSIQALTGSEPMPAIGTFARLVECRESAGGFNRSSQHLLIREDDEVSYGDVTDLVHGSAEGHTAVIDPIPVASWVKRKVRWPLAPHLSK
jgi:hypothetical protein